MSALPTMLDTPDVTVDAFLNGRVEVMQPADGHHRSGLDALVLSAALGEAIGGEIADLGAGVGVAGMCVAARAPAADILLVERELDLARLAGEALRLPANRGFADRVRVVTADLFGAMLAAESVDHAIMNPPFHDAGSVRSSPNGARARAHVLDEDGLDGWFRAAARLVRPRGTLSVILPAERLPAIFAFCAGRFGALVILPLHPRAGEAAIRVIVRGIKGNRAPLRLLPGLVLNGTDGRFTPEANRLFGDAAALADVAPGWPIEQRLRGSS